eukprot:TRINITY_DN369_c0_g1_i5.p4 TRINITY_DN369_c0_g1~~TRINITY_DN369_c0_g1_i5.p4  ORF type:complete len:52 (+),score=2.96 TRINITY_DN369_c0_g1_i5:208-363(+)
MRCGICNISYPKNNHESHKNGQKHEKKALKFKNEELARIQKNDLYTLARKE